MITGRLDEMTLNLGAMEPSPRISPSPVTARHQARGFARGERCTTAVPLPPLIMILVFRRAWYYRGGMGGQWAGADRQFTSVLSARHHLMGGGSSSTALPL